VRTERRPELADLDRRFVIAELSVDLPSGPVVLEKPRNPDDLISEADYVRDERLPYWADLWPASVVLARYVAASEPPPGDPAVAGVPGTALELGCGLGLGTIAAMRAGYTVTSTDYYADATLFTARNALRAMGTEPTARMVDWRALPEDLGTFDLVLAADVLYELPHAELVAETLRRTIAPGGRALLADQGRLALGSFLESATAKGLSHRVVHREDAPAHPPAPVGSTVKAISIYELRHAGISA
jgi:predicted nicotinamide N-methyase